MIGDVLRDESTEQRMLNWVCEQSRGDGERHLSFVINLGLCLNLHGQPEGSLKPMPGSWIFRGSQSFPWHAEACVEGEGFDHGVVGCLPIAGLHDSRLRHLQDGFSIFTNNRDKNTPIFPPLRSICRRRMTSWESSRTTCSDVSRGGGDAERWLSCSSRR